MLNGTRLWLSVLISSGLICLNLGDVNSTTVNPVTALTVQNIDRLYSQVLLTSINNSREVLSHLNDTNAIDKEYFTELDRTIDTDDYYSTAYFIFVLIHSSLFDPETPDKLLLEIVPAEIITIRNFFAKVHMELHKYLTATHQIKSDLMRNITRYQGETGNSILLSYIEFPEKLQNQIPELQLMDYMKQARGLVAGIAQGIQSILK